MTINNDRVKIIDRIINLLAKADSTTFEAEAEVARKMAAKLMANYEINKAELEQDESIIKVNIPSTRKRRDIKHAMLYTIICDYCGVYMVTRGTTYILCGKGNDIESAMYMIDIIWNQMINMVDYWYKKNKKNPNVNAKTKNNYLGGLIVGVEYNLDKINNYTFDYKKSMGLVPVNQNKVDLEVAKNEYTKNNNVKSTVSKVQKDNAFSEGFKDSENISMRRGVNSNKSSYMLSH